MSEIRAMTSDGRGALVDRVERGLEGWVVSSGGAGANEAAVG